MFVKEVDVDACVEFAMQSQMGDCPCEYHFPGLCHVVQLFNKVLLGEVCLIGCLAPCHARKVVSASNRACLLRVLKSRVLA